MPFEDASLPSVLVFELPGQSLSQVNDLDCLAIPHPDLLASMGQRYQDLLSFIGGEAHVLSSFHVPPVLTSTSIRLGSRTSSYQS